MKQITAGISAEEYASLASLSDVRHRIAARIAYELQPGDVVNLGIGIPTMVADYIPQDREVFIHSENGILGAGMSPSTAEVDPYLVNAGKQPITELKGASYFSSADSFAMIRSGRVSVAVMGGLQVDEKGRIANWAVPGKPVLGVGGAMDLLVGTKRVIVAMTHCTREGESKLVRQATYPLTGERPANMIVTDLAVFHVTEAGLMLIELMPGSSLARVAANTQATYQVHPALMG